MSLIQKIIALKHKKGLFALADQMVHSGTTFLTGILVGRLLSVGEFGEFSLGLTLVVFSMVLQDNCLATPYTYRFHNIKNGDIEGLRAGALIQSLLLAVFCTILLGAAYFFLPVMQAGGLGNIIFTLALSMPFLFIRETSRRIYFTEFRVVEVLMMDIIVTILQVSLIVAIWYLGVISAANVFAVMALASFVGGLWAFIRHRHEFNFSAVDIKADTVENIRFGKWLLVGSFCHLGSLYIFPWLIYALIGGERAGLFAACYTLVNLINPFILGFNNFYRPKIMKLYANEGLEVMHAEILKLAAVFFPVSLIISGGLALAGGHLVHFVYGEEFVNLGTIIAVIGLSVIPVILNAPLQLGILALNKPQINPKFHSMALASTLCIGVPLVFSYEAMGAAIGFSLSVTVGFLALVYFYMREIKIQRAMVS